MSAPKFLMPMANSHDAPRFSSDPSGFDIFFEDVAELAERAELNDAAAIKWACRYAGSESDSWRYLPCMAQGREPRPTLADFKTEVLTCYPHISVSRRYTYDDLDRLIKRTQTSRDMSRDAFREYYRQFITFTAYLIKQRRYSEQERSQDYLRGLPNDVRGCVLQRLAYTKPDIVPRDGYNFGDLHKAMLFVLEAGASDLVSASSASVPSVKVEPTEQASVSELARAVAELTRVFSTSVQVQNRPRSPRPPTPGGVSQNAPWWSQNQPCPSQDGCTFCSARDHYVRDCPIVTEYIDKHWVIRNGEGKITLPSGYFVPSDIRGANMRERVDKYWSTGPARESDFVETHFLEGPDEYVFYILDGGCGNGSQSNNGVRA